jgi:hypothetical protein
VRQGGVAAPRAGAWARKAGVEVRTWPVSHPFTRVSFAFGMVGAIAYAL